jgi:hypothetical protein
MTFFSDRCHPSLKRGKGPRLQEGVGARMVPVYRETLGFDGPQKT